MNSNKPVLTKTNMNVSVKNVVDLVSVKDGENGVSEAELHCSSSKCHHGECSDDVLSQAEIMKYSRHLIMREIGVAGQLSLKNTSVLIVGAGGLGCPAGLYLAASGIGKIGIVDFDTVDESNLQRQIAHTETSVGKSKSSSFAEAARSLNRKVECVPYDLQLSEKNISEIIVSYDIILDASDNVPTRYLLSDAAVLHNKPLVSGSALRFEGQLTVYNYAEGPCYRCLHPAPPPPEAVQNCSEGGILGAVTGVIGSLQALEVIKIAVGLQPSYSGKILVFDALEGDFKVIKLRGKNPSCDACGQHPSVLQLVDYEQFCNSRACDKAPSLQLLSDSERISCKDYMKVLKSGVNHVLVDVRPSHEMSIAHLPGSVNIELSQLKSKKSLTKLQSEVVRKGSERNYVVCRRGNDSQKAVQILKEHTKSWNILWYDIIGGLHAWHNEVDLNFPLY